MTSRIDVGGTARRRQVYQPSGEQLGQGELRGRGDELQDRTMQVATTGGAVSTRRDLAGNGDVGGAARRQAAQSPVEQLGQGELRGRGGEVQDDSASITEERWEMLSRSARKHFGKTRNKRK